MILKLLTSVIQPVQGVLTIAFTGSPGVVEMFDDGTTVAEKLKS